MTKKAGGFETYGCEISKDKQTGGGDYAKRESFVA